MIEIYTDASVSEGKSVATCFVVTDTNFLGYKVTELDNISTSLEGELEGAIAAIEYVKDVLPLDKVTLYSDSISLIRLVQTNLRTSKNKQVLQHLLRLSYLQKLVKKYSIKLCLIKGHSVDHNPNKVVDLISNSMLRFKRKENCND